MTATPTHSNKITLPATSTPVPLPPTLHSTLLSALLAQPAAVPRIQSAISHELAAAGWTTALRTRIAQLLRNGDCATYEELMARVLREARGDAGGQNGFNGHGGENGDGEAGERVEIKIPEKAVKEGVKAVRRELEAVCEVVRDGE
ncbi:hypothetical protein W97_09306 [Coniosporium apollinis CBS 100218]|uniref:Uncharacterized protein n=1 Tax=Coniosporium apollinis (strain CBS 100218) TaxID=1168221 RepID=R7Z7E9_CONA1|nr:uncharacterized protein W97_09306 [Coniosporium apollinis CBS 100218]EON70038.1 hypothetical protein W97_09306 [Coniosporium apollinis CBS 100218]